MQTHPAVTVTRPEPGGTSYAVELPGRLQAYSRAPIYARVSGYLKKWNVDIGSPVQAGQTLAGIEGFKKIVAPFSGIVTARLTDVGALINAGSGTGVELFVVSDTHKLRLYVNVPQNYATRIVSGTQAQLTVPERPGRTFTATVESSAQSVDP